MLITPHLLTNFEIQKYQNESSFNGIYSINNLSEIKDGLYLINVDEDKSVETHWIALYVNDNNVTFFDSIGVQHILKEIKKLVGDENINVHI